MTRLLNRCDCSLLRKTRLAFACRLLFILLVFSFSNSVSAQNISWLRWDNTDNSSDFPFFSETLDLATDADGNVYTLLFFFGEISIGDGADEVILPRTVGASTALIKHSPDGQLLWHRYYPFLGNRRVVMDVSPNGTVLLVAEVRGDWDTTFQGQPIQTEPLTDYMFYVWLNTDGDLLNWRLTEEIFEDFKLETLTDVLAKDDLTFWLSGGYAKEQFGENFTRHDIEFITYFNANAEPIQRNHFDAGERGEEEIDYIFFDKFQEVGGEIYIPARGNGFYGYDQGVRSEGTTHGFMLKINGANTIDLILATTDASSNLYHAMAHGDGSFSILSRTSDGVLRTNLGDFDTGVRDRLALSRIKNNQLVSSANLLNLRAFLVPVKDRDDLVGVRGIADAGSDYIDGHFNGFQIPTDGPETVTWIGIYNADGKLDFIEYFDALDNDRLILTEMSINDPCDGFYLAGWTLGAINLNLGEGPNRYSPNYAPSRYFYAKYENEPPELMVNNEFNFCPGSQLRIPVILSDESLNELQLSIESANGDFDPSQVSFERNGIIRYLDITNVVAAGDFTLKLKAEDACGAVTEQDILIRLVSTPEPPVLSEMGEYTLCTGDTLKLTATAEFPLLWSDGSQGDTLKIFEAGEYWANQLVGGNCNGANSDTLRVIMAESPQMPVIEPQGSLIVCPGNTVTLTASLNERLVWSTGETTQSITVSEPGVYSVYQTSELCGNSEVIEVEVRHAEIPDQPEIELIGEVILCEGEEVLLRSSAGANSRWSTGDVAEEIRVNAAGSYSVRAFDGDCEGPVSESVMITVSENFSVNMVRDTTVCELFEPLELNPEVSRAGLDFLWSDGSTGSSLLVSEPGEYWVEVSNGACSQLALVSVEEVCLPLVFMPNAFSPNGDGDNDLFAPVGQRALEFKMIIYNEWGRMVFISNDLDHGWDGTLDGQKAPAGKYVYQVNYKGLINGELLSYSETGKLDLIR